MYDKDYLGKNNFVWFNGVVEDRQDPQKLGRLRVRCVGIHTDNKDELPTADLPWSQLIHPITCLLYTSPSPRDVEESRMPSSA